MRTADRRPRVSISKIEPVTGWGDVGPAGVVQALGGIESALLLLVAMTPAQLVANTDDWDPVDAVDPDITLGDVELIRASTDASRDLTGLAAPDGRRSLVLENVGAFDLVLKHDTTSAAANRFLCPGDVDLTLPKDSGVLLEYDTDSARWRFVGAGVGPTGPEGIPGLDGLDGSDGAPGARGADGNEGLPGLDGMPGLRGAAGADGIPGLDGLDGMRGPIGNVAEQDHGTITAAENIDVSVKDIHRVVLGANVPLTLSGLAASPTPTLFRLRVVQPAAGGPFTITSWFAGFGGTLVWRAGVAPTLSVAANAIDIIDFDYDSINGVLVGLVPGTTTGPQGPDGLPGMDGLDGRPGIQGIPGLDGLDGSFVAGPPGGAGTPGLDGLDGGIGPAGVAGATGLTGATSLLAITSYNPAITDVSIGTNALADVDATNLKVTFVAPPSGSVLIRLNATGYLDAVTAEMRWGLREGSTTVAGPATVLSGGYGAGGGNDWTSITRAFYVTGLTPGQSYTYKWGWLDSTGASAVHLRYGGVYGPAVMEVWSADTSSQALASAKVTKTDGDITTSSTAFVDATGLTVTLTTGARKCRIAFFCNLQNNTAAAAVCVDVAVDGTRLGQTYGLALQSGSAGDAGPGTFVVDTDALTAGSHTIKIQWRVDNGASTGKMFASAGVSPAILSVQELPNSTAGTPIGTVLHAELGGNVNVPNTGVVTNIMTLALSAGTWLVNWEIGTNHADTSNAFAVWLTDGTTDLGGRDTASNGQRGDVSFSGSFVYTTTGTPTLTMKGKANAAYTAMALMAYGSTTAPATRITAVRIA